MEFITKEAIIDYKNYLIEEEKAKATVNKYLHDITVFMNWLGENELTKSNLLKYKQELCEKLAPASVNSVISSLNGFFVFFNRYDLKMKNLRIQRQMFTSSERELTKADYERLLRAAKEKKNERLYLLMQAICATGIRVSELSYITAEAVSAGFTDISCKGKQRRIILPRQLCKILKSYLKAQKIKSGPVFLSKNGRPLDRSNIWADMKALCESANVSRQKVFPHNLRHLFARTYYSLQKDIVRLADILGHSSINTTRIYTVENGDVHRQQMQKMGLVLIC